jgi:trans-aconitate 2-methyltransferase
MASDAWNPDQYERFRDERSRPFYDLLELVRRKSGRRVVDLGCGTGELTRVLHERLWARTTLGIDSSAMMLSRSTEFAGNGVEFAQGDIATFSEPGTYDLIFSNAALQWVPDNPGVIERLTASLAPGGELAVQVPANHDHPSHATAAEVAMEEPFIEALGGVPRGTSVLAPEEYAMLLDRLGYVEQHVRMQIYGHHLRSREDVIEWVRGTLLTYYQRRLSPELFDLFLDRYRERLLPRLDDSRPYFYPFKRILFWGKHR